ncbi:MAG TPA: stalk domain-containing protein [Caldisericia bacterium]|nr:stalk domain-containing protein [Caldisericia bacterium]
MKNMISFLLVLSLAFSWGIFSKNHANAIHSFRMEVRPRVANKAATYRFHFTIEKLLEVHDWIKLGFPKGTIIEPPLPEEKVARDARLKQIIESMSIGLSPCSACQGLPIIAFYPDGSMQSLTFNSHIELDPSKEGYRDIVVTVPDTCGFKTPANPGTYAYGISNQREPGEIKAQFEIVESRIGEPTGTPEVIVDPSTPATEAKITISFNVGRGGWLRQGQGLIKLRFPEGTRFNKSIKDIRPEWVKINGSPLPRAMNGSGLNLNFTTPIEIEDSAKVVIEFDQRCGIENPSKPGMYQLEVGTSIDDWVKSNSYQISKTSSVLLTSNNKTNREAEYRILIPLEKSISGKIIFELPTEIQIENDFECFVNDDRIFTGNDHLFELILEEEITDILDVKIIGLKNPKNPGIIRIKYRFESDKEFSLSSAVEIVIQTLEIVDVTITPPNVGEIAEYHIKVIFGDGKLPENRIIVHFSHGAFFEVHVYEDPPKKQEYEIIAPNIDNRTTPGTYIMNVSTDKEVNAEYEYTLFPPAPKSSIKVEGKKGNVASRITEKEVYWHTEIPIISFEASDPSAEIWVWWDDKIDQKIQYDGAKPADPGQYIAKLWFQAKTPYAEEAPKFEFILVDTLRPEVVMVNPISQSTETGQERFTVKGRTTELKTVVFGVDVLELDKIVVINGENLEVDEKGNFSKEMILVEGDNMIMVGAQDEAGNTWSREYMIRLDTIAPKLMIEYPKSNSKNLDSTKGIAIIGYVDDKNAEVLIDGQIVYVEQNTNDNGFDGVFEHSYHPQVGKNKFSVEATDSVGNKTSLEHDFWFGLIIIMQVGNKSATVNGEARQLLLAPFIQNGRTLVPFRFIGEEIGAKVGFTSDNETKRVKTVTYEISGVEIVLTIGSKTAIVNEQKVELDVAPQIVAGTTVVPVRFVTENLGCEVKWEAKTQEITILYPK